jgi:hypothetical protein
MRLHAHLFRHNFLTEKALDGENPSVVKRWAGHKKYEMTEYYFGIAQDKLAAIQPKRWTLAGMQLPGQKRLGGKQKASSPPRAELPPSNVGRQLCHACHASRQLRRQGIRESGAGSPRRISRTGSCLHWCAGNPPRRARGGLAGTLPELASGDLPRTLDISAGQ